MLYYRCNSPGLPSASGLSDTLPILLAFPCCCCTPPDRLRSDQCPARLRRGKATHCDAMLIRSGYKVRTTASKGRWACRNQNKYHPLPPIHPTSSSPPSLSQHHLSNSYASAPHHLHFSDGMTRHAYRDRDIMACKQSIQ